MASIKLSGFERRRPQVNSNVTEPRVVDEDTFRYKDIKLDLEFSTDLSNSPDGTSVNTSDLGDLRDENDLKQSVKNIFRTMPGQKLLNPYFGLNMAHYCFDPINSVTADHIARTILIEVPQHDPRINIKHLSVVGDIENAQYNIEFTLSLPDVDKGLLNIKGILNSDGFDLEY